MVVCFDSLFLWGSCRTCLSLSVKINKKLLADDFWIDNMLVIVSTTKTYTEDRSILKDPKIISCGTLSFFLLRSYIYAKDYFFLIKTIVDYFFFNYNGSLLYWSWYFYKVYNCYIFGQLNEIVIIIKGNTFWVQIYKLGWVYITSVSEL